MVSCRGDVELNVLYIDPGLPGQPNICRVFDMPLLARVLIQEILTFEHAYDETGREGQFVELPIEEIQRVPSVPLSAPMLLHTETTGGHQGAAGRHDELAQLARMYAFAIWQSSS
jgi:hypothetical protein